MIPTTQRRQQKGNVLFLILIAVALFAALSYAVTQSGRSGGDSGRETNAINSAELTQFPNQVRQAVTRLGISRGTDPLTVQFNRPDNFTGAAWAERLGVFHPNGGGVPYAQIPQDVMAAGATSRDWVFNAEFHVPNVGTTAATPVAANNELVVFAVGVNQNICLNINEQLNDITTGVIPAAGGGVTAANIVLNNRVAGATAPAAPTTTAALLPAGSPLLGRAVGCFVFTGTANGVTNPNILYVVLAER